MDRLGSPSPTPLCAALALLPIVLAVGCSATLEPTTTPTPSAAEAALLEAAADAQASPEEAPLDEYDRAVDSLLADAMEAESRRLALDEPDPEENVEPSPLDEIADIDPGEHGSLEEERQLVEAAEPTFDYPIEINDKVLAYIDYFTTRHHDKFQASLARSGRYLEMVQRIFEEEGVPRDLAYMAHVESAFKVNAYSRAKAKGIFQFISGTARRYGMRVDTWVDERSDPERSARAAAVYLRDLYGMFGDWYLALAAYNTGEGRIQRSINRMGQVTFWELARTRNLYRETKNYVPAILAATVIAKQPEKYGFEAPPDDPLVWETVDVPGAIHFDSLARVAGVESEDLRLLNPHLRRQRTPPNESFPLRVPPGFGERVLASVTGIPDSERVVDAYHKVRRGENLSVIARRYGVSVRDIQSANRMGRRTLLRAGQTLVIPGAARGTSGPSRGTVAASPPEPVPAAGLTYRVRRGDTLSGIARRHGSTPAAIASASGIRVRSTLHIGQRLTIPGGGGTLTASTRHSSDGPAVVVHTVRRGENLWRIAGRYRVTVDEICTLNDIKPDVTLYPGTRLTIRAN